MWSGRASSYLDRAIGAIALTVVFAVAGAGALPLHADLPAPRRLIVEVVNRLLAVPFGGRVRIGHVDRLSVSGIAGASLDVFDPTGETVLHADGVRARVRTAALLRSVVARDGPLVIELPVVAIDHVETNLDAGAEHRLRLAEAFSTRPSASHAAPTPPGARSVRVEVADVRVRHAWMHGAPPGAPPLDVDVFELSGGLRVEPEATRVDVVRAEIVSGGAPRALDPRGVVEGSLTTPSSGGEGVDVRARFDGDLGGLATNAALDLRGRELDLRLEARDATGESTRAALSEITVRERVELRASLRGELPRLDARATLTIGRARADVSARVDVGEPLRVDGTVMVRNLDLAALVSGAPASELDLDGLGGITVRRGELSGVGSLVVHPGTIDRGPSPRVDLSGRVEGARAELALRVDDPRMPTELFVEQEGRTVSATLRSSIAELSRVPVLGRRISGAAVLDASARLERDERTIAATVAVRARDVRPIGSRLRIRDAQVRAAGFVDVERGVATILDPRIDAVVDGGEPPVPLVATARLVRVARRSLRVDDLRVTGLGAPVAGSLVREAHSLRGRVVAERVDLARLAALSGHAGDVRGGDLSIRAEGELRDGDATLDLHAEVARLGARKLRDARAVLDVSLHERRLALAVRGELGSAGRMYLTSDDVVLDGRATAASSWRGARGRVEADVRVDLNQIASLLPHDAVPFADLRGELTLRGRISRARPTAPPEVRFSAWTQGLLLAGRTDAGEWFDGVRIEAPPRWRSSNLDLGVDAWTDGTTGLTSFAARLTDREGVVVGLDVKTIVPWNDVLVRPASAWAIMMTAPLSSKVVIPPRRLERLPSVLAVKGLEGTLSAELDAAGSLFAPRVRLVALARAFRAPAMPTTMRTDTAVVLGYENGITDFEGRVRSEERELFVASGRVKADLRDAILGQKPLRWGAEARARLRELPLASVPMLAAHGVGGVLTGELSLEGLHEDAHLVATIDVAKPAVADVAYERGSIRIDAGAGALTARAKLDRPDGFLDVAVSSGLSWGADLEPSLDPSQPLEATILAKALRATVLRPLVDKAVPSLDGLVDGAARLSLVAGREPTFDGTLTFRDGVVDVAMIGEELRNVRGRITASADGRLIIDDVFARGARGEVSGDASLRLEGIRLVEATGRLRIPDARPLNLAPDGQPIGQVSGSLTFRAARDRSTNVTHLSVDVPRATVEMPQVSKGGLQSLERREDVRVGVYRDEETFVALPLDRADTQPASARRGRAVGEAPPERFEVDVRLGRVEVIRANEAQVVLTGQPTVTLSGDEWSVEGRLDVMRGWAVVQGKKFQIERGTITWSGDEEPTDPTVVATAAWLAPDGTRVFADFIGAVTTGKVTLRSEPALPEDEILALVLFGTPTGGNPVGPTGTQTDGTTRAAIGLGGGVAAEGLANALDELTGLRATARIDTTRSNNLRPEIEIQLSPRVSISFAHVLGTPPITEPDRNFATVEYRFYKNWSVETTAGDRGRAMVDAVWQRRY